MTENERQEKVRWLRRYREAGLRLSDRMDELARWEALSCRLTSSLSETGVHGGSGPKMDDVVAEIVDAKAAIATEISGYKQTRQEVVEAIRGLPEECERDVLECRYLKGMYFEEIAKKLCYSERQVRRMHNSGLINLKMSGNVRSE